MKAVVYTQYGPPEVLRLTELPKPKPQRQRGADHSRCDHRTDDTRIRNFTVPRQYWLIARLLMGVFRPVIDRCYPLEQIVEASRYLDTGNKKGNVVIQSGGESRKGGVGMTIVRCQHR